MKKTIYAILCFVVAGFLVSCGLGGKTFDSELLHSNGGHWTMTRMIGGAEHTVHQRFMSDGSGFEWTPTDGVNESDAQAFQWTLDGELLSYRHQDLVTGGYGIPEGFTVLKLTATTFEIEDTVDGTVYIATKQ